MNGEETLSGRVTRECAAILYDAAVTFTPDARNEVLRLMGLAYLAGRTSAMEEWGASLDRLHGAFAEASE